MRRFFSILVVVVCGGLAIYSGSNLNDALGVEQDFRTQIAEYTSEADSASNGLLSGIATVGANSINVLLERVIEKEHEDEWEIAAEALGIALGLFFLLRRRSSSSVVICIIPFLVGSLAGCKDTPREPVKTSVRTDNPSVSPPAQLPRSSIASNSAKSSWVVNRLKNPITGNESVLVSQRSKRAMYNKYDSDGFSKVTLNINCSSSDVPSLALSLDAVLQSDSDDHYLGDAKIDQSAFVIRWYVKSGTIVSDEPTNVVQRMQMGKTFMMGYRFYEGGTEYPEFDLTGLRTVMNRAGCPKLTENP